MIPPSVREGHCSMEEVPLRDENALTWGFLQGNGSGKLDRSLDSDGSSV